MAFDEGYGGKPPFLRALDGIGQNYVGEVPVSFTAWTKPPAMRYREHVQDRRMGRPRKLPRLKVKNNPPVQVRHIASYSPLFRREDWQTYHVKDGHKGPMVWKANRIFVWLQDDNGLPTRPHHPRVAYHMPEPEKLKYVISNAPENTSIETLLLAASSRWKIERMFEDGKGELGMDPFEVRKFLSIRRHLILSCVSYLFLAEFHQERRGEKPGPGDPPSPHGGRPAGTDLGSRGPMLAEARRVDRAPSPAHPTTQCPERPRPPPGGPAPMAVKARLMLRTTLPKAFRRSEAPWRPLRSWTSSGSSSTNPRLARMALVLLTRPPDNSSGP